jgi:hypothetical protein
MAGKTGAMPALEPVIDISSAGFQFRGAPVTLMSEGVEALFGRTALGGLRDTSRETRGSLIPGHQKMRGAETPAFRR